MNWTQLPLVALVTVFDYLRPKDRYRAALVCKHWASIFNSGRLWQTAEFYLDGSEEDQRVLAFIDRLGYCLRSLTLSITVYDKKRQSERLQNNCRSLFNRLLEQETSLHSFTLESIFYSNLLAKDIVDLIGVFLESQRKLVVLEIFTEVFDSVDLLLSLLQKVSNACGSTTRTLNCQWVFPHFASLCRMDGYLNLMKNWQRLQSLSIQYSLINSTVLQILINGCKNTLKYLMIIFGQKGIKDHSISSSVWKQTKTAAPLLKVHFCVDLWYLSLFEFQRLLPPEMPLYYLESLDELEGEDPGQMDQSEFFNYLALHFQNTLEFLDLGYFVLSPGVHESLVTLASCCWNLVLLNVIGSFTAETVEALNQLKHQRNIEIEIRNLDKVETSSPIEQMNNMEINQNS